MTLFFQMMYLRNKLFNRATQQWVADFTDEENRLYEDKERK